MDYDETTRAQHPSTYPGAGADEPAPERGRGDLIVDTFVDQYEPDRGEQTRYGLVVDNLEDGTPVVAWLNAAPHAAPTSEG